MKLKHAIVALSLGLGTSGVALAQTGTINVTGQLFGQNCRVNGQTQDAVAPINVALPGMSVRALQAAGATSGLRSFRIALSECPQGTYYMHFEANTNTNLQNGTLRNTAAGDDVATNVEVQLLNNNLVPIHIVTNANSQAITTVDGNATYDYYMRYISLGNATAGRFTSTVAYSLAYN